MDIQDFDKQLSGATDDLVEANRTWFERIGELAQKADAHGLPQHLVLACLENQTQRILKVQEELTQ